MGDSLLKPLLVLKFLVSSSVNCSIYIKSSILFLCIATSMETSGENYVNCSISNRSFLNKFRFWFTVCNYSAKNDQLETQLHCSHWW